jgi:hypothetical protein
MIDNFMTGDTSRPDWSVELMADGDTTNDDTMALDSLGDTTDAEMTTEWSTGSAQTGTGTWAADWHGGGDDEHPMAVTGTFDAHIGGDGTMDDGAVGRLQGAFAAE